MYYMHIYIYNNSTEIVDWYYLCRGYLPDITMSQNNNHF